MANVVPIIVEACKIQEQPFWQRTSKHSFLRVTKKQQFEQFHSRLTHINKRNDLSQRQLGSDPTSLNAIKKSRGIWPTFKLKAAIVASLYNQLENSSSKVVWPIKDDRLL